MSNFPLIQSMASGVTRSVRFSQPPLHSFIDEVARVAEQVGGDVREVENALKSDNCALIRALII